LEGNLSKLHKIRARDKEFCVERSYTKKLEAKAKVSKNINYALHCVRSIKQNKTNSRESF